MRPTLAPAGPNILLVMTDQQRWDALGRAGTFPVETPNLDRLAREGVWFRHAYCQAPLCVPSRMSFFSGRYPHQHRCLDNQTTLWPDAPSFVRGLREAGYRTANVGKLHYTWAHDLEILVSQPLLKKLGFDEPSETTGKMSQGNLRASPYSEHLRKKGLLEKFHRDLLRRVEAGPLASYDLRPSIFGEEDHIDGWIMRRAEEWVNEGRDEPFFLWAGPPGPHDPFDPPEPYASMYRPEDMPLGPMEYAYPVEPDSATLGVPEATPHQIQEMRTQYLGNVTLIDAGVGRILEALERNGQASNTWVFFLSDHGEMLGDHRLIWKTQPFDAALRVPLIVRPPDGVDALRGVASDALVELLDVPTTMLDVAGATLNGDRGRSLLPKILGREPHGEHREFVVSEYGGRTVIRTREWKLVVRDEDRAPLFLWNLRDDPHEEHDLAKERSFEAVIEELRERIEALWTETPADMPEPWFHDVPYGRWGRNPLREITL